MALGLPHQVRNTVEALGIGVLLEHNKVFVPHIELVPVHKLAADTEQVEVVVAQHKMDQLVVERKLAVDVVPGIEDQRIMNLVLV